MKSQKNVTKRLTGILLLLSESKGPLTLSDLSNHCRLPPSTMHRLLTQLSQTGMVTRAGQRGYAAGPALMYMALCLSKRSRILRLASPIVQDLAGRTGRNCALSLYVSPRRCRVNVIEADITSLQTIPEHRHFMRDLVWGAPGRAILAHLRSDEAEQAIQQAGQERVMNCTRPPIESIRSNLEIIRCRGYAISNSEVVPGGNAIATPIFGASQLPLGSLMILERGTRWDRTTEKWLSGLLSVRSQQLQQDLRRNL